MDFLFRYNASFFATCHLAAMPTQPLFAYLRVTPKEGKPVVMIKEFELPPKQPDRPYGEPLLYFEGFMEGGFAVGTGQYSAELVITDRSSVMGYKRWQLKTKQLDRIRRLPLAQKPNTVASLDDPQWDGKLDAKGIRMTVLMDVAPFWVGARSPLAEIDWSPSRPERSKVPPEDRLDLVESLAAVLTQIPCRSVRVVAFNLDQQTEVFRQDKFTPDGMAKLSKAMEELQLVTVPSQALARNAWADWLSRTMLREVSVSAPPEVVVFLGPRIHFDDKFPDRFLSQVQERHSQVFYFKLDYPSRAGRDAVEQLTGAMRGRTLAVYSPETLQQAIEKVREYVSTVPRQTLAPGAVGPQTPGNSPQ